MIRAIGCLLGVCLTVAAFLLVLGLPAHESLSIGMPGSGRGTAEQLSQVVDAIAEQVDASPAVADSEPLILPAPDAGTVDNEGQSGIDASAPVGHQLKALQADVDASDLEDSGIDKSYVFWGPFRSKWAAQGFAGRLTSATQVAVEVVDVARGEYRVAFSYRDEAQRLARIRRIETITGLDLE